MNFNYMYSLLNDLVNIINEVLFKLLLIKYFEKL